MSVGSILATGAKALVFSVLDASTALNSVANRVSGGSINRDTLAQSVLRSALTSGLDIAASKYKDKLGDKAGQWLPLVRDLALQNDSTRISEAAQQLAEMGADAAVEKAGINPDGLLAQAAKLAAGTAGAGLAKALVPEKLGEKVVAALVTKHTDKPLRDLLEGHLSAVPFGKFITSKILAVIQRAMVDPQQAAVADNPHYTLVGDLLNEALTGKRDWMKPLRDYAPTTMAVVDTGVHSYQTVKEQVSLAVDQLQETLGMPPEPALAQTVYASQPPLQLTSSRMTDALTPRDLAEVILSQRVHAQTSSSPPVGRLSAPLPTTEEIIAKAHTEGTLGAGQAQQLQQLTSDLSPQQINPLGERGDIAVEKTWSNTLQSVLTVNHAITDPSQTSQAHTTLVLAQANTQTHNISGYDLASAYSTQVGELALKLPADQLGYTDMAMGAGWSAWGFVKAYVVEPSGTELTIAQSNELKTLWNCCGGRADALAVLTRYLDPDLAKSAVAAPLLAQLQLNDGSGLVDTGTTRLKLGDDASPDISFEVSIYGPLVTLSMTAEWPILQFGQDIQSLRSPKGEGDSRLTATAVVQIRLSDSDGNALAPPTVSFYPMGYVATIENRIEFDRQTGSMQ